MDRYFLLVPDPWTQLSATASTEDDDEIVITGQEIQTTVEPQ